MAEGPRPKSRRIGILRRLWPYLMRYRRMFWAAVGVLTLTAALTLTLPLAARRVIDGLSVEDVALMERYFIYGIIIAGALAIGTSTRYYLVTRLGERVIADLRQEVFDKVIGLSPEFYESLRTGEVLSRLNTDTTLLLSVVSSTASIALRQILLLIGGLAMMSWTSPRLTMFGMVLGPLILIPILVFGRRVRRLSRESQDRLAESSALASELLLAAQTVQAYTAEAAARSRYADLIDRAFEAARKRILARSILTVVLIFLVFGGLIGVLWIGASDLRSGSMSAGELVQFLIYGLVVAGAAAGLSEVWGEVQRAAGATERLVDLLETDDPLDLLAEPVPAPARPTGEVVFDRVAFRYPARPEVAALSDVSFRVAPGETVALVGPSGAGKSTIFQLLLRFYDVGSGEIRVDDAPVRDLDPPDLRRAFSIVSQEPAIFADTVAANIRFGRPDAADAEVEAAARAAAAHDFIEALPRGYGTYVGERGVMLSGGQKQRLAIARAVLRDAPILLLDEATSALDAQSERAVQQAVERLSEDRTTLVIAHRLATVKAADRILVFDGGRVVSEGSHAQLVAEGGLYARLARLQFTEG
ncbi:MAG: ABC transporter transmembrane domain-containing protein [Pseudomonadota bacterium]